MVDSFVVGALFDGGIAILQWHDDRENGGCMQVWIYQVFVKLVSQSAKRISCWLREPKASLKIKFLSNIVNILNNIIVLLDVIYLDGPISHVNFSILRCRQEVINRLDYFLFKPIVRRNSEERPADHQIQDEYKVSLQDSSAAFRMLGVLAKAL